MTELDKKYAHMMLSFKTLLDAEAFLKTNQYKQEAGFVWGKKGYRAYVCRYFDKPTECSKGVRKWLVSRYKKEELCA